MTTDQKIIKTKLGFIKLAEHLGNVSEACKVMGYSRDSFYRFKELYETGGAEALREITRSKPNLKNRVAPDIEEAVNRIGTDFPAYGQQRAANELKKTGIFLSPAGIRGIWQRNDLEIFPKRLKALEARIAQDRIILTEAQLTALEKAKEKKEANGEIETHHPEYLGAGYLLCMEYEGSWKNISADLHRYLHQSYICQVVLSEKCNNYRRSSV